MTALFINLKIDNPDKLDFFKVTLSDIESLFYECHIKIRGELAGDCISFAKELLSERANFYQDLQEKDWVAASLLMIENVKSRSIFFYLEDHKLIIPSNILGAVLDQFDKLKLDYMCYSFFRSSHLNTKNLLPLNPKHDQNFSYFILNNKNIKFLKGISPLFYTFSLASISSTDYFKKLLDGENKKFKIYIKKLSSILTILFSYPKYRIVFKFINSYLSFINSRLFLYPYNSPFNMEKINSEMNFFKNKKKLRFGILKNELFANYDDDNNAYGESLIKRGLYPFDTNSKVHDVSSPHSDFVVTLKAEELYDCSYYSQIHRIKNLPRVFIKVNYGKLYVNYCSKKIKLEKDDSQGFFTNLSPIINCMEDAEIVISVYDECFG